MIDHSDEPVSSGSEHVSRPRVWKERTEFKNTETRAWSDIDIQCGEHGEPASVISGDREWLWIARSPEAE